MSYPTYGEPLFFTFDRGAVIALLAHTLETSDRSPSTLYGQREGSVPAGLWLVLEHGIYLMSNGRKNGRHGKLAHPVAYALEANPDTVPFTELRRIVSDHLRGDDTLYLHAEEVRTWLDATFGPLTCVLLREGAHLHYELVDDRYSSGLAKYARAF